MFLSQPLKKPALRIKARASAVIVSFSVLGMMPGEAHAARASKADVLAAKAAIIAAINSQTATLKLFIADQIRTMTLTLQGEIAKQTNAMRAVEESIATYEIQEQLRRDAADIESKFVQPAHACESISMSENIQEAAMSARERAASFTKARVNAMLAETNPVRRILNGYERSTTEFCSEYDIETGRCKGSPKVVNGDISASHMFSSATSPRLSYDENQVAAVDALIERLAGSDYVPRALPARCETDQCKAYEELRKSYVAMNSLPMHSLSEIASTYIPQTGLATKTGTEAVLGRSDASVMETIEAFINMKFSADAIKDAGTAQSSETILREMAANQAFRLWIEFNVMRQMERMEAMQATELALLNQASMRSMLDQQYQAAMSSLQRGQ